MHPKRSAFSRKKPFVDERERERANCFRYCSLRHKRAPGLQLTHIVDKTERMVLQVFAALAFSIQTRPRETSSPFLTVERQKSKERGSSLSILLGPETILSAHPYRTRSSSLRPPPGVGLAGSGRVNGALMRDFGGERVTEPEQDSPSMDSLSL